MVFSSIPFLFYFLPCVLLCYFLVPAKGRNVLLLAASLLFYTWGEPIYVLLMIVSILIGYGSGLLLEASLTKPWRILKPKLVLGTAITLFVGIFVFFKYTSFLIDNFNAVTGLSVKFLQIALPIGISFYTFQIVSYLIDVYRGEAKAQRNFISLALYVSMFPQLIAGPIVRYKSIDGELKERRISATEVEAGIYRFVIGLAKKVLIANQLGALCETFRGTTEPSVLFYWLYAIAFCLHIYFDFSGYSDMAIGLGKIMGFHFPENFDYPYISTSITEFWRRWHMSLGTWFRDYLYIPLGGNRVSKLKWYRNILLVWMFTGFWHGASWNFVLWGLGFGVLLVIEKKWLFKLLEWDKYKIFSRLYVSIILIFSFVLFNAADLKEAYTDFKCLLGFGGIPFLSPEALYYLRSFAVMIPVAAVGATPFMAALVKKVNRAVSEKSGTVNFLWQGVKVVGTLALFVLSVAYLVDGSFNPFLYFRF